ncbi:peptidoglycan recognition protein family protein [Streptomyces sp. enrichment culture]|uniref:peptidoglycan recognition protein family protein n=1 Tax=Streptomyces sp. enrichment culture TaxID=1795815 RepID=UPI003F5792FD
MRGFLASSIGVTCAAALALPLTLPATTATARPAPAVGRADDRSLTGRTDGAVPGETQSLPLLPLASHRALGSSAVQGLPPRDVRRFSLVGVVWDDPAAELHGRVQVRTRLTATGEWTGWQDVETHYAEHAPDLDSAERTSRGIRGATAPLWVGESDGVEIRVQGVGAGESAGHREEGDRTAGAEAALPSGLRVELVDPGRADDTPTRGAVPADAPQTGPLSPEVAAASRANAGLAPLGATEIPALGRAATQAELAALLRAESESDDTAEDGDLKAYAKPKIGPRPRIVTRRGWGADEKLREKKFGYTKRVKAAFVHHTATGNTYRCSQAPSVIRSIYRYHVKSMGWRDIGYNFLVDRCGNIYEGRAGGVAKPVLGAHTLGFNTNSTGIAVLGTFNHSKPSASAVQAIARLTAWKLGIYGVNPRGKTYLKSGGGNRYPKGRNVRLNAISGHRDGYATLCPGGQLYGKLGTARWKAAEYQGR